MTEPNAGIEVAVVIVSYNSRDDLGPCLDSLIASDDGPITRHIIVVDNASTDGSADFVEQHYADVDLRRVSENIGFAGGCNVGWRNARRRHPRTAYLALLNPDTVVESGWLASLVRHLEAHPRVGAVQPKILLHDTDETGQRRINTVGNRSHYMGFGFMTGYGERDEGQYEQVRSIDFASGAAMVARRELLEHIGLFDEAMYLYLEDADLSWKVRQLGHDVHYVPGPAVLHKYAPTAPQRHHYELERNRYILLLTYYRWRTLFLLMPILTVLDIGMWGYTLVTGRVREQWRVYTYLFRSRNLDRVMDSREAAQRRRKLSDRQFMGRFAGEVHLPGGDNWALRWIGNPLFAAYWWVARRLIFW